ncbi:MAG: hypothetical protein KKE20_03190 [Nanoarchaeota archaeon]|nr:hypothetical protein [Nanoarchaeota archaeon]
MNTQPGLIISIRRHCEKDGDKLTPDGIEHARVIGRTIEIPSLEMIGYHSNANRTRETIKCIFEGAGREPMIKPAEFGGKNILDSIVPHLKNGWPSDLSYADAVKYCFDNESEAMRTIGGNLAKFICELVKVHDPNDNLRIEAISHGPNLECYIMHELGNAGIDLLMGGLYFKEGQNFIYHPDERVIEIPHAQLNCSIK